MFRTACLIASNVIPRMFFSLRYTCLVDTPKSLSIFIIFGRPSRFPRSKIAHGASSISFRWAIMSALWSFACIMSLAKFDKAVVYIGQQ